MCCSYNPPPPPPPLHPSPPKEQNKNIKKIKSASSYFKAEVFEWSSDDRSTGRRSDRSVIETATAVKDAKE